MVIYSECFPLKMVIFHSYVKLPEGRYYYIIGFTIGFMVVDGNCG